MGWDGIDAETSNACSSNGMCLAGRSACGECMWTRRALVRAVAHGMRIANHVKRTRYHRPDGGVIDWTVFGRLEDAPDVVAAWAEGVAFVGEAANAVEAGSFDEALGPWPAK